MGHDDPVADPSDPLGLSEMAQAAATGAGVDPALLGDFLATAVAAVASGTRVRSRDLRRFAQVGRQAATAGVPLRALVDLYLSAAWRLWRRLPTVETNPIDAGEVMLRAIADVTAVLAEGYQLARRDLLHDLQEQRREFVDDLLLGGAHATAGLIDRAARFGVNLAGPHAVLVVLAERPFTDTSPLIGRLERTILGSLADADPLVATRDGRLVIVFAAPDRPAITEVVRRVTGLLPGPRPEGVRLERTANIGEWHLGVGRPGNGAVGIRISYEEAVETLDLGRRVRPEHRVHEASDLLLHRVLARDEIALTELIVATLTPLGQARGGAEPLIDTLDAYFAAGGNASACARSLHLSVRALTYRLDRIRDLTGLDPADPADRFTLQTAVTGYRLLGTDLVR